jgi:hypothetical protein
MLVSLCRARQHSWTEVQGVITQGIRVTGVGEPHAAYMIRCMQAAGVRLVLARFARLLAKKSCSAWHACNA